MYINVYEYTKKKYTYVNILEAGFCDLAVTGNIF